MPLTRMSELTKDGGEERSLRQGMVVAARFGKKASSVIRLSCWPCCPLRQSVLDDS